MSVIIADESYKFIVKLKQKKMVGVNVMIIMHMIIENLSQEERLVLMKVLADTSAEYELNKIKRENDE